VYSWTTVNRVSGEHKYGGRISHSVLGGEADSLNL